MYNASGYCIETLVGYFGAKNFRPGYVTATPAFTLGSTSKSMSLTSPTSTLHFTS